MRPIESKSTIRSEYYTIGDISKLYHVGADSLRYYEDKGLLTPERSESGYRLYKNQDIWRLNVIEELRSLGIAVNHIKHYLESGTIESTLQILNQELTAVKEQIAQLTSIKDRLECSISDIAKGQGLQLDTITIKHFEERHASIIPQRFNTDEEMDLLMKRLVEEHNEPFHIIGNHRIAAILSPLFDPDAIYNGALIFRDEGTDIIPAGDYLSICYAGEWNSRHYARLLIDYAAKHRIRLDTPFMDLVWIDIHATSKVSDHISEIQVLIMND